MTHQDTAQQRAGGAEAAVAEHNAGYPAHAAAGTEHSSREQLVLERIERARRARPRVREKLITLAHGAGGKATQSLIEDKTDKKKTKNKKEKNREHKK